MRRCAQRLFAAILAVVAGGAVGASWAAAPLPGGEPGTDVIWSPIAAAAQQPQAAGSEDVYVAATSLLRTMVQLPEGYDPGASYTLVVGLHGHGGRQLDFFGPPAPLFRDAGIIYAVPQAPYAYRLSGNIGYSWNLRDVDDDAADQGDEVTVRYILDVVTELRGRYNVGDVYLMGFSQGGTFTYLTAIGNPAGFAGFATFGSSFNDEWFTGEQLAAANHLRAFVAGGTRDSFARQEHAHASLQAAGYDVTLHEFDAGHTITRAALEELIGWVGRVRS